MFVPRRPAMRGPFIDASPELSLAGNLLMLRRFALALLAVLVLAMIGTTFLADLGYALVDPRLSSRRTA